MSLYNTLFGVNPCAGTLLKMIGADVQRIPRFRDCFLRGNAIVIYTRVGGGNREDYAEPIAWLRALPGFLTDHDASNDSTYAYFAYSIPAAHVEGCELLRTMGAERDPDVEWARLMTKLKNPAQRDDPEVMAVLAKMAPVMQKLEAALKGDGPHMVEV